MKRYHFCGIVAVADGRCGGEVLQLGNFLNRPDHIEKLAARLAKGNRTLSFCYEAGPCGYGLFRQLVALGHDCMVAAPSLIPMKAGDRVKTDRRDPVMLAKLHRAGELTAVWVPDDAHEAMRDLIRARATAVRVLSKARQHLQGFLLRHGRVYAGKKGWTQAYRRWLTTVRFDHVAQQLVLQDYIHAVTDAEARVERLLRQIEDLGQNWSQAPVVAALQAMRGVAFIVPVTLVAEVGDFSRFANPRQLMAYLGLVPSEHSSGRTVHQAGITKAGNALARRDLIEGAWTIACNRASAASCMTVSRPCRRWSATLAGRLRSGFAPATAGSPRRGSPKSWSPPPSPARCSGLFGRSLAPSGLLPFAPFDAYLLKQCPRLEAERGSGTLARCYEPALRTLAP